MDISRTVTLPPTFSAPTVAATLEAFASAETGARVVVFCGAESGVFNLGMDLGAAPNESVAASYSELLRRVRGARVPTIAAVSGRALGGGLGIAAACDRVIAESSATFGLPELLVGLLPAMVLPVVLERMTVARARGYALAAAARTAADALGDGLVDHVCPEGDLDRRVKACVRELARVPARGVGQLRDYLAAIDGLSTDDAIARGAEATTLALQHPDTLAAIAAFQRGEAPWRQS